MGKYDALARHAGAMEEAGAWPFETGSMLRWLKRLKDIDEKDRWRP